MAKITIEEARENTVLEAIKRHHPDGEFKTVDLQTKMLLAREKPISKINEVLRVLLAREKINCLNPAMSKNRRYTLAGSSVLVLVSDPVEDKKYSPENLLFHMKLFMETFPDGELTTTTISNMLGDFRCAGGGLTRNIKKLGDAGHILIHEGVLKTEDTPQIPRHFTIIPEEK